MARRLVFHVGGYEPLAPDDVYRRFTREVRRFERTWSAAAAVSEPRVGDNEAAWRIFTSGPNWRVETDYRFVRWDDLIAAASRQPMWRRIPLGFLAFFDFLAAGALWGYLRTNWRYAGFFLYPWFLFAAFAALAAFVGIFVAEWLASTLLGVSAGALIFCLLLRWPGRRLYLSLMFDDWIFARAYVRRGHPVLDARLDRVANEIAASAHEAESDEILIIGHSLGAVLAVDLLARALVLDPALGRSGPRLGLLSVGSSILKIGLHGGARRFRAAVERVASAPGVFWAEYQAITDVMNFYKSDPVAAMGLGARNGPVVRAVRISRMLDPAYYRRVKRDFFRMHRQFVSGNDRRAAYDYFMLSCGPLTAEAQARSPDGAASLIGPDGALLERVGDGEQTVDRAPQKGCS